MATVRSVKSSPKVKKGELKKVMAVIRSLSKPTSAKKAKKAKSKK